MEEQEDKRIRRTKKLLRQALTRLMQQKDIQSITVTDVVRAADINRGTFYAHYRDVYDLRERIEQEMISDFRAMIEDIHPDEVNTSLRPVISRAADYLEENREVVTAFMRTSGPDGFGRKLIEVVEECRMEASPCKSEKDRYVARFVASGMVGMLEKWITADAPMTKDEMVVLIIHVLETLLYAEVI